MCRSFFTLALCLTLPFTGAGLTVLGAQESATVPALGERGEDWLVSEAFSLFESGQAESAMEGFQAALERDAHNLSARLGLALVFADQRRFDEAFFTFDQIVQAHPRHAFAWNGRGLAAFNLGNFEEALYSFEQSTAEHPVNGFFYESLAWTLMCQGDFSRAAQSAKQATIMYQRSQESSVYPLLIAYFSYLEVDDTKSAMATLRYAQQNRPAEQWPSPVIDYLSGEITAADLISFVVDSAQETEAHAYIGLHLRSAGDHEAGDRHLAWVARSGNPSVFEFNVARAIHMRSGVALRLP